MLWAWVGVSETWAWVGVRVVLWAWVGVRETYVEPLVFTRYVWKDALVQIHTTHKRTSRRTFNSFLDLL